MSRAIEVLERIARSDDAVFAFDRNDLVILWNKACENLLGRPAYQVLGRRCYDVLCGRDVYGNLYCCVSCPIVTQARNRPSEQLHEFLLDVPVPGGGTRRVSVTPFTISGGHPSLATLVHVVRDPSAPPSRLEHDLAEAVGAPAGSAARPGRRRPAGPVDALTDREQEILRRLARGMSTDAIAKELFISTVTVRNHVARILGKLEVHTKLAAVAFAYQHGLVGSGMAELPSLPEKTTSEPRPASRAARPARRPSVGRTTRSR
jgi:DNA-binding CsgD family transcriptional regulator